MPTFRSMFARSLVLGWLVVTPAGAQLESPAQIPMVGSDVARSLSQVDALAAAAAWSEAVDAVESLLDLAADSPLVAGENKHFTTLAAACHARIVRWPPEGLAAYRQRVDSAARARYEAALAGRDGARLAATAERYFASSWGDDTLWACGELALERGDTIAANRALQGLTPTACDSQGRPWGWLTARQFDAELWPKILDQVQAVPQTGGLAFPDTSIAPALIRARLAMVAVVSGDLQRAEAELELLRQLDPAAVGKVAGRNGELIELVAGQIVNARGWRALADDNWQALGGDPAHARLAAAVDTIAGQSWSRADAYGAQVLLAPGAPPILVPATPVITGETLLYTTRTGIAAVKLATGEPLVGDGILYRERTGADQPELQGRNAIIRRNVGGQIQVRGGGIAIINGRVVQLGINQQFGGFQLGVPSLGGPFVNEPARGLCVADGILYSLVRPRLGPNTAQQSDNQPQLVGLDLARQGLTTIAVRCDEARWRHSGPPVVSGDTVYVPQRHGDNQAEIFVSAHAIGSGKLRWRSQVATSVSPLNFAVLEQPDQLTASGDSVYYCSNDGALVALDARSGRLRWGLHYPRESAAAATNQNAAPVGRAPQPCIVAGGRVFAAPLDSTGVIAADAATGHLLWHQPEAKDTEYVLGLSAGRLVATGKRLSLLDPATGRIALVWPDTAAGGAPGRGRGCLAGDEIFWPTVNGLLCLSAVTGQQTRTPMPLGKLTEQDTVCVVVGRGHVVAATPGGVRVFGPQAKPADTQARPPQLTSMPRR